MNKKIVFLEGKNDLGIFQKLLESKGFRKDRAYEGEIKLENHNGDIIVLYNLNGWNKIKNETFRNEIIQRTEQGYDCYLILDADDPNINQGGIKERKKAVEQVIDNIKQDITDKNITICFFLLPDNENDGDLEVIIQKTISSEYKPIYDCLRNYVECLSKTNLANFEENVKTGLKYLIHEDFPAKVSIKERKRISDLLDYSHECFQSILRFLQIG